MAKNALTPVPAKVVREFAREGRITVTDAAMACITGGPQGRGRGRLHPDVVAAFNAENGQGLVYDEAVGKRLAGPRVDLPLTKMNAKGARLKRPESFSVKEIRSLAGVEGKRGRLSKDDIAKAAAAVEAARGWDKPAAGKARKG